MKIKEKYGTRLHFKEGGKPCIFLEVGKKVMEDVEEFLTDMQGVTEL